MSEKKNASHKPNTANIHSLTCNNSHWLPLIVGIIYACRQEKSEQFSCFRQNYYRFQFIIHMTRKLMRSIDVADNHINSKNTLAKPQFKVPSKCLKVDGIVKCKYAHCKRNWTKRHEVNLHGSFHLPGYSFE